MYKKVVNELASTKARLVAVSKTRSVEEIMEKYEQGQRIFGENRVQELVEKQAQLPGDIEWHLIGTLQSNKVKYIAPFVKMIHSVDSMKLLKEINKQAAKHDRTIDVLLQFKIAQEYTKMGLEYKDAVEILESKEFVYQNNINITGVMGMASFVEDEAQVREEFSTLYHLFKQLKNQYFIDNEAFKEVSMGMSGDYKIAIEEGSTLVRIGSLLFGPRNYG